MTIDDALTALAHPTRRKIVAQLRDELVTPDGGVSSSASPTSDAGQISVDADLPESISMYHTHLPKLEAGGFVTWDREAGTVQRGSGFSELLPLLEAIDDYAETLPTDAQ